METHHTVPNEIWIKSLAYLDAKDLLAVGLVDRSFLKLSSDDSIWYELCNRRWRGKFNVARFFLVREYNEVDSNHNINRDESISIPFTTAMTYCSALIEQFDGIGTVPALNMGSLMHQPSWWKESYWMAELDSRRRIISREELVNFRFQLIYNGVPSRMGLRHFNRDGYYDSPYMGRSEWILHGEQLIFAGISLKIERNEENWGWVIGRGQRTEYRSVELIETNQIARSYG